MSKIKLSRRLEAIVRHIPPTGGVADVGTDHGYIPIFLLQNGFEGKIDATDINPCPLNSAKRTAAEQGLSDRISFHLCNGLSALDGEDTESVVIAGMGGETISSILEAAPWTKEGNRLLILQPMSKSERLRIWLSKNGYRILTEELVEDGAVYEIMTVCGGKEMPYAEGEMLTGRFHLISQSPLFPEKLEKLIEKYARVTKGLSGSSDLDDLLRLAVLYSLLDSLRSMKKRLETEI